MENQDDFNKAVKTEGKKEGKVSVGRRKRERKEEREWKEERERNAESRWGCWMAAGPLRFRMEGLYLEALVSTGLVFC